MVLVAQGLARRPAPPAGFDWLGQAWAGVVSSLVLRIHSRM